MAYDKTNKYLIRYRDWPTRCQHPVRLFSVLRYLSPSSAEWALPTKCTSIGR